MIGFSTPFTMPNSSATTSRVPILPPADSPPRSIPGTISVDTNTAKAVMMIRTSAPNTLMILPRAATVRQRPAAGGAASHVRRSAGSDRTAPVHLTVDLLRHMLRARAFEDQIPPLAANGFVPGHTRAHHGNEGVVVGLCAALQEGDTVATYARTPL